MTETVTETATFRCVSDRYDGDGTELYTADEFTAMCLACFGEAPELYEDGDDLCEWIAPKWWEGSADDARRQGHGHAEVVLARAQSGQE